jgi:hypothetical protein
MHRNGGTLGDFELPFLNRLGKCGWQQHPGQTKRNEHLRH